MQINQEKHSSSERVIFAPEGFLDQRYIPVLKNDDVRIIEIRYLADGPVLHTIKHHPMHS